MLFLRNAGGGTGESCLESSNWVLKAYREGAVFTAFDLETTGLDPRLDKIVEIGAIKFDRKGPIARFSTLINPGIPMPPDAERVNKISDEMLKGKPSLDKVLPDFLLFIRNTVLMAHNAPFDCGFINEKLKERLPNPQVCTLVLSREAFPGHRSYALQNLAADLRIPSQDAHRAEDDALLCMEIFFHLAGAAA